MRKLDRPARELFGSAMARLDRWWDGSSAIVRIRETGTADIRSTMSYALGALMRNGPGDRPSAHAALDTVLRHQWDAPGTAHHGSFARTPAELAVPATPRVWRDYDPNYREFIGTMLALVELELADRVPPALTERLRRAVRLTAEGAHARAVSPRYTNIALLSAWLLDYAGNASEERPWRTHAARLASDIHALFRRHRTFPEYNSPTYYGTDLAGLAHWRRYGSSEQMRRMGAEMEEALWRDVAAFYHPGLRNLCGPWVRAYGRDMARYCALLGLWIALATGPDSAPLPDLAGRFEHLHDIAHVPRAALLGARVPAGIVPSFTRFAAPRRIERVISDSPPILATAWLGPNMMIGGLDAAGHCNAAENRQCHPAMLHWRAGKEVGWIRLLCDSPVDARACEKRLEIRCRASEERGSVRVGFDIAAAGGDPSCLGEGCWRLPGLAVALRHDPPPAVFGIQESRAGHRVWYEKAPGDVPWEIVLQVSGTD